MKITGNGKEEYDLSHLEAMIVLIRALGEACYRG